MEEVIICVALCLFMNGELVEHTYQKSMSDCLKAKRVAMRTIEPERIQFKCGANIKAKRQVERAVNPENVRMQCGEVDAIIEEDKTSNPPRFRIVKIVKDKYDSSGYTK